MKEKEYESSKIEICRNCHGTGRVKSKLAFVKYNTDCEICKGSGTVKVTKHTNVIIEPYSNGKS